MTNLAQNKRIHGLRKQLRAIGFDDPDYRALLIAKFPLAFMGVPSSKDLSFDQAVELIEALKELAGESRENGVPKRRRSPANGPACCARCGSPAIISA